MTPGPARLEFSLACRQCHTQSMGWHHLHITSHVSSMGCHLIQHAMHGACCDVPFLDAAPSQALASRHTTVASNTTAAGCRTISPSTCSTWPSPNQPRHQHHIQYTQHMEHIIKVGNYNILTNQRHNQPESAWLCVVGPKVVLLVGFGQLQTPEEQVRKSCESSKNETAVWGTHLKI